MKEEFRKRWLALSLWAVARRCGTSCSAAVGSSSPSWQDRVAALLTGTALGTLHTGPPGFTVEERGRDENQQQGLLLPKPTEKAAPTGIPAPAKTPSLSNASGL